MERLKGKTILVGKEPGQGRLLVSVQGKTAAIGSPGCVPNCVSRCKPTENVAHAKIAIDQNGNITLSNMKSQNVTFVNGSEIESKRINQSNTVELGKDKFSVSVPLILETAKKIVGAVPPPPQPPIDISHLDRVWKEYHSQIKEIKARQRKLALWSRIPMFFTMGGGVISGIAVALNWSDDVKILCIVMTVIGLVIMIMSLYKSKNDTSMDDMEKLTEKLKDSYVCPNCKKELPLDSYKRLLNKLRNINDNLMYCPHCKRQLIDGHQ